MEIDVQRVDIAAVAHLVVPQIVGRLRRLLGGRGRGSVRGGAAPVPAAGVGGVVGDRPVAGHAGPPQGEVEPF